MLKIWIGRAGTGKSDKVLKEIAARRSDRTQILMVPEHASFEAEKDICQYLGDTASLNAEVLTFQNMARRVLSECGGISEISLDNGGKILTLRRCLQEISGELSVFSKPSQKIGFLEQLTDLMDELYAYEISPDSFLKNAQNIEGATGEKLKDLAKIYAVYDSKLNDGKIDSRSRLQKLRDKLAESSYICGKDVYFDGFSFFNKTEDSIIRIILTQAHDVIFTLLGDEDDTDLFSNAFKVKERLIRMANEVNVPYEEEYLKKNSKGEIPFIEQHLFGNDAVYGEAPDSIRIYEAESAYDEVEDTAKRILEYVQKENYRFKDISIACRNTGLYAPLIENIFQREQIPIYISRRTSILEKNIFKLLTSALDTVTNGFTYDSLFQYLKTGITGISMDDCDLLENYVILWNIHGDFWLRDNDWKGNPTGYQNKKDSYTEALLAKINRIRGRIYRQLHPLYEGINCRSTTKDKATILYTFSEQIHLGDTIQKMTESCEESGELQTAQELRQLWDIFCNVLDQMVEILGDMELSGEEFSKLFRLVCSQYSTATIPSTLDQVKISDLSRNDRHEVKIMFLIGANDHLLPMVRNEDGILDKEDREVLAEHQLVLSDATFDIMDNELQNIYACLVQPQKHLIISYPILDSKGGELRPSFIIYRLCRLFPQLSVQKPDSRAKLRLPGTALVAAGNDIDGPLWKFFEEKEEYRPRLDEMRRASSFARGVLSPDAVCKLYSSDMKMSASRIDRLKTCHFSYFLQYGLRTQERQEALFDAPQIGTMVHYLLEHMTKDVIADGGFHKVSDAQISEMLNRYTQSYIESEISDYETRSPRFRYLLKRIQNSANKIALDIASEMRISDFEPISAELSFGGQEPDLPPIVVENGNFKLTLTGKIDRVDGWRHDDKLYVRVIDYKTGSKSFTLSDLNYGLNTQMLLYLFSLKYNGKEFYQQQIIPCGILYLPAHDNVIAVDREDTDDAVSKEFHKQHKRSGLLLNDANVIEAMEYDASSGGTYLPVVYRKKEGKLAGSLASEKQFLQLDQMMDGLLQNVSTEIINGKIDADPISEGPDKNSCQYCPYVKACSFENGMGNDIMRHKRKFKDEDFWARLEVSTRSNEE